MKPLVILSSTITETTQIQLLPGLPSKVKLIEIRADLFEADLIAVKNATTSPLLFSLKSKSEGGAFTGSMEERVQLIVAASAQYDFIELEGERDLIPAILEVVPTKKRIISWQGRNESYESLKNRFQLYQKTCAKYYRFVVQSINSGDGISVLRLLKAMNRNDLIAYAIGPMGIWTQPLSAFIGSPIVPSVLNGNIDDSCLSPHQLIEDYNLPYTYNLKKIFGIVGDPVIDSISPKLHNKAYRTLNLPNLYLPFHVKSLKAFFNELVNADELKLNFSGLTVGSPLKEAGFEIASTSSDPEVTISKASNIIVPQKKNRWAALSTDAIGAIDALNNVTSGWQQKSIAIIGCGGTGRTIAASLKRLNVEITLVNRTTIKGEEFAKLIEVPFVALSDFDPKPFDFIIHATPLGKIKGEIPFTFSRLKRSCVVIDHVYALSGETDLVHYCRLCNITVVNGKEIARLQIRHQFKLMTGISMPAVQSIKQKIKTI